MPAKAKWLSTINLKRMKAPGETNIIKKSDIKAAQSEFKETIVDT